ncbi:bifunctional sulfate adenylyltransferase/adenylylsulfate kinase [Rhodocaloribacter litoris]|uniref:bifunctional sulfate adenylyltransferase/adenylylsulfate kinase n=1 Tax=Rhodocaloribacter litoris TaxID=2558931 RepID=UPI001423AFEF|nr:bifunctional sulfate adenylyltransferase/adenylylsulfate kinase [Rhodocaloribacter litoris]QXD14339.1 bifunctional sulfate adenylyltransferase/adenylylsulfate kinase [Rhodocaloribacter litoris]
MKTVSLIEPHGGELCELLLTGEALDAAREAALHYPSITLTPRQICDIELLLNGGFSPLRGFLNRADYDGVVENMRLADGTLWPIPVTLDVPEETAKKLGEGDRVALRDQTGLLLAVLTVGDVWRPDKQREAEKVFGTTSTGHPAVAYLFDEAGDYYVGGTLEGIQLPRHYDFHDLRRTPRQMRALFEEKGWDRVVAFQTRNPMHRAHKELTDRAAEEIGGHLLIHPVVGMTKPGDIDYYTRVRCYRELLKYYPEGRATISLLPLAMRMGGPREAVWHAIIRKNYGCTHLIVGRDHAGPGKDRDGTPFYGPYDAQELILKHSEELGIGVVDFKLMVYVPSKDTYMPIDEAKAQGLAFEMISGTQLRRMLADGDEIPAWFSYPEVVAELRKTHPPKHRQGFTVFFTGLSGSGKSTIANALMVKLLERGGRPVTLLDGDVVRTHLSKGLGFSKEDRSTNVQRIGFVASEITKHRGIALCAPIAPYEADRRANRNLIEQYGGYIEVFVDTPLEECEKRDVKGLYAKARAGIIKGFTGIDDPYEAPTDAEIVLDTVNNDAEACADQVLHYLIEAGYLKDGEA